MSYKSDFEDSSNWNAVDTNSRLNTNTGKKFVDYLKENGVGTIIRYFATNPTNPKTITAGEADFLLDEGFWLMPIFQDRNRLTGDFGAAKGTAAAQSARSFAERIGQPKGATILFAVDADFSESSVKSHIVPYFKSIQAEFGGDYRIGAYGGGAALQILLDEGLIDVPWLSMSRLFHGTRDFFYANAWGLRQIPLPLHHAPSGVNYDKDALRLSPAQLGAFSTSADAGGVAGANAHLGEGGGVTATADAFRDRANAFVATEGLNFREEPNGDVIRSLTLAEPVVDLGVANVAGWRKVEVGGERGAVFGKFLREPAAPVVESLIRVTVDEWLRFGKGSIKETADPQFEYIGEMWRALGFDYDGRDTEQPWSAAFISHVVRQAGEAYDAFKFSIRHSDFANDAINARTLNWTDRPFWGYRITEKRPKLGDIVLRNRNGNAFSFDHAENHSRFQSHSDVVVEVRPNIIRVMGGNVGNSVSMERFSAGDDLQEYDLTNDGFIAGGQNVIALLSNRADQTI